MTKISETVVFFGSGPVAAESLRLLADNFAIEAVVTKPRASHHKGDVPVLTIAEKLGLPVHTITDKHSLDELLDRMLFQSRVGLLIDFGIIVSPKVIDHFPLGIINSHFSLLPEWRGADPITFAILSGQKTTGVSLMLLVEKMDEGPLLAQAPFNIQSKTTTPELTEALIDVSYQTLCAIAPLYLAGDVSPAPQEMAIIAGSKIPTYSRKLTKNDGVISWEKSAIQLEREIRAFIQWPKSHTTLGGKEVLITKAHSTPSQPLDSKPGDINIVKDKSVDTIMVTTGSGSLCIDTLKPIGKPEMTAQAFLAGYGKLFA